MSETPVKVRSLVHCLHSSHTLQHVQLYCELFKQKGGLPELRARTLRARKIGQKQIHRKDYHKKYSNK